jgi:hypothetical protein
MKPTVIENSFAKALEKPRALRAEIADASRIERCRLNASAYLAMALKHAGTTRSAIDDLDQRLVSLPNSAETGPAQRFVLYLTKMASDVHGTWTPPDRNFPYNPMGVTPEEVAAACLDLKVSRLELAAVAALRATRDHPEVFELGCNDATAHELKISDLKAQLTRAIHAAAHCITFDDLHWNAPGKVTYTLSHGNVPATGPGDHRGIEALLNYLDQHQNDPDQDGPLPIDDEDGMGRQVRRV